MRKQTCPLKEGSVQRHARDLVSYSWSCTKCGRSRREGDWLEPSLRGGQVLIMRDLGYQAIDLDFILRATESFKNFKQESDNQIFH